MAPQDGEDLSFKFIPGGDRFAGLLRNRQYRGRGHDSPSLIDREKDRVYKVKSFDFQEKNQVALPNYVADREAKNVKLPQQSDAMDKVLKCPAPVAPPPPYEELPNNLNTFSPGKSVYIVSNARGVPPELSIEHKFEPPNNIHLRIKIQNCGYWVSQLAFKIKFCNGDKVIGIEDYQPQNEKLEHTVQKRRTKENLGAGLNLKILNPVAGGGDIKFGKDSEYDETKESYIGIQALPENDHWIRWMWHTYGNSVGPLKEITLMVSIGLPKEKNISQLKASFEAHAKYFERSTIVGNIGRFIMGESAESHTGSFQVTVHFKDVSVTQKPEVVVPVGGGGIERSIGVSLLFLLLASVILFTVVV